MPLNSRILSPEVQAFIRSEQAARLAVSGVFSSPFPGISPGELAVQIKAHRRACEKLPSLAAVSGIVYPPGVSMEQCSGEAAARYKAGLVPRGELCADITGGLGVDTLALSERFRQTEYYETQTELAETARHNFSVLQRPHIRVHTQDGIRSVLENGARYDLIYADPARRDAQARRVFSVSDCTPDIAAAKDRLLQCSPALLVKLSPMLDIAATVRLFPETSQIHVVAVRGEVKELLFLLHRGHGEPPRMTAADLYPGREARVFSAPLHDRAPIATDVVRSYLYDPSAALRKAGLADAYCAALGLRKLHPQTLLYTGQEYHADFQGRVFRSMGAADKKNIGRIFPERRASVAVRNYPGTAGEISRKYKLGESDRYFLLAFRDREGRNTLLAAERVRDPF